MIRYLSSISFVSLWLLILLSPKVKGQMDSLKLKLQCEILNIEDNTPIKSAEIKLIGTDGSIQFFKSDSLGNFNCDLKANTSYAIAISKKGFLRALGRETTVNVLGSTLFRHVFKLEKMKICTHRLPITAFHFNQNKLHTEHDLNSKNLDSLNYVITFLQENPTLTIALYGHQDEDERRNLYKKRIQQVRKHLIMKGIHPGRIEMKLERTQSNNPAHSLYQNRFVEYVITGNEWKQKNN